MLIVSGSKVNLNTGKLHTGTYLNPSGRRHNNALANYSNKAMKRTFKRKAFNMS